MKHEPWGTSEGPGRIPGKLEPAAAWRARVAVEPGWWGDRRGRAQWAPSEAVPPSPFMAGTALPTAEQQQPPLWAGAN